MSRGDEHITGVDDRLAADQREIAECRRLIDDYPLAWVCADGTKVPCLLPLIGQYDTSGKVQEIVGHFAVSNPLGAALERDPNVTFLFTGPHGYISPRTTQRSDWGPTWNYAQLAVEATVRVDRDFTAQSLELLTHQVEHAGDQPWSIAELGDRYNTLVRHIVGFRAEVTRITPRFKLGQDEKLTDLRNMLANMPQGDLRTWMMRFNRERLANKSAV